MGVLDFSANRVQRHMVRSQLLELLEQIANGEPNRNEAEWVWLLDELNLPAAAFVAVLEVLKQGRWRDAGNPKAYLRTASRREFHKMEDKTSGLGPLSLIDGPGDGKDFSMGETLDTIGHVSGSSEASKGNDGVWRRGGGRKDEFDYDAEHEQDPKSYRDLLLENLSGDLKRIVEAPEELKAAVEGINQQLVDNHIHVIPWTAVDWNALADRAGFDHFEKEVLHCRLNGVSRDQAMERQPDDTCRKAIQAAWRKFGRTGQSRLRSAAKIASSDVPE